MQEPLLRAKNPYPAQETTKKTVPIPPWIHPYSLYLGASLSIYGVSIFYFIQMASSSSPFVSEDAGPDVLQLVIEFLVFPLCWWLLNFVVWWLSNKRSGGRRGRKKRFQSERGITWHVLFAYTVVMAVLLLGACWLDVVYMHYWQDIFLVLDVALPFIVVLWWPSMHSHRKMKQQPQNVKTSFTDFKKYLRNIDVGK